MPIAIVVAKIKAEMALPRNRYLLLVSGFWSPASRLWLDYQQEASSQGQAASSCNFEINRFGPGRCGRFLKGRES
jgi:hypothetical protein